MLAIQTQLDGNRVQTPKPMTPTEIPLPPRIRCSIRLSEIGRCRRRFHLSRRHSLQVLEQDLHGFLKRRVLARGYKFGPIDDFDIRGHAFVLDGPLIVRVHEAERRRQDAAAIS